MKKLIISGMAVAMLALPAVSSADVQRYQSQTATFAITQPAGAEHQWDNLWTHNFRVDVNPCDNTFSGSGSVSGHDQNGPYTSSETITGTFGNNGVTFTVKRPGGLVFSGVNVNGTTSIGSVEGGSPWILELKATKPVITKTTDYKNHGEFVKQADDKNDAAHSCIGMPINSSK